MQNGFQQCIGQTAMAFDGTFACHKKWTGESVDRLWRGSRFGGPTGPFWMPAIHPNQNRCQSSHQGIVVRVNQTTKNGLGCLQVARGGDEDTFPGVQVVAICFSLFLDRQRAVSVLEASCLHCHHLQTTRGGDS